MFFDGWGEFDCECGGVCGFASWSVHFGFVILLMMWMDVMRKMVRRRMSILLFFSEIFFQFFWGFFTEFLRHILNIFLYANSSVCIRADGCNPNLLWKHRSGRLEYIRLM